MSSQNLFALLVQCLNYKMQFWLQCMPPHQILDHLHTGFLQCDDHGGKESYRSVISQRRLHRDQKVTVATTSVWGQDPDGGGCRNGRLLATWLGVYVCVCPLSPSQWTRRGTLPVPGSLDHESHVGRVWDRLL